MYPPQEIVRVFFLGGFSKRYGPSSRHIAAGKNISNCAIFAARIHTLQNNKDRVRTCRVEQMLKMPKPLYQFFCFVFEF
jgi:hypothetical protein